MEPKMAASLPADVLLKVFQHLDSDLDICRCAQVSRHWHDVAEDPTLREVLTIDTLGSASPYASSSESTGILQNSPESGGSPVSLPDSPVGDIEESLAMLPKRCSKLVSLEIRQVPPNVIDGLLAAFLSECPDLQDLVLSLTTPPLRNFALCQLALGSQIRSLTIEAALLSCENSYEQLSQCRFLESLTFLASGLFNPYQFIIGLQILFSECRSPLARITLPEYAPLASNTLSQNLLQLVCLRFGETLTTLNMWPVRCSEQVVDSLCSLQKLTNISLFEAKFSRLRPELWQKLNAKLNNCTHLEISHSVFSNQVVQMFTSEKYDSVRELICVSCEFDDDLTLIEFLNKFKSVATLEFHLHYGLSFNAVSNICQNFAQVQNLTLSDLTLPGSAEDRNKFVELFQSLATRKVKLLSLAFIRKEEETLNYEDAVQEVDLLSTRLKWLLKECEISIELDAI